MILQLSAFAWFHTVLSLVAIVAGAVATIGVIKSRISEPWTAIYFVTGILTSVTGFGFPYAKFEASHWVGVISLVIFAAALIARYGFHFAGAWRWIYSVGVVLGFYFLIFVLIAQAFKKVPSLMAAAPTLSEPPFALTQLVALVIFAGIVVIAARAFRREAVAV